MTISGSTDTERGSRDLWLTAAYEALVRTGVDSVRVQPLGKLLGLSRTSFYWFFEGREELLDALVELWRDRNTGGITRQADAYAEGIAEAILNVFDCWLDRSLFDSEFEFAVRSWALQSPRVASEIATADETRMAALARMFERHGFVGATAEVRARTIYLTQIGYISMKTQEDLLVRVRRIPDYVEVFTGVRPKPNEVARFHARHAVLPGVGDAAA